MRALALTVAVVVATCALGETQVIDGKLYECGDGMCRLVGDAPSAGTAAASSDGASRGFRIAQGYMDAGSFVDFLENREVGDSRKVDRGLLVMLVLALLGGLAMNLTPCVLPMIPVNLIIIGRSAKRGMAYGVGVATAYGALGVAASLGGMAFGEIQGSPWFSAAVAVVFAMLGLAMAGLLPMDFSRFRPKTAGRGGAWFAFGMGVTGAALAGACVAPVLVSVLVLAADMASKGRQAVAVLLPLATGVGMALPWPFAGAGLSVLPRPGAWMKWVNRVFGAAIVVFAAHYAMLAVDGWTPTKPTGDGEIGVAELPDAIERAKRPLLVKCGASWCGSCKAMDRTVLKDAEVVKALGRFEVIGVRVEDVVELRKVRGFGSVKGLPAFVIWE